MQHLFVDLRPAKSTSEWDNPSMSLVLWSKDIDDRADCGSVKIGQTEDIIHVPLPKTRKPYNKPTWCVKRIWCHREQAGKSISHALLLLLD
jgi:hypothetical protein